MFAQAIRGRVLHEYLDRVLFVAIKKRVNLVCHTHIPTSRHSNYVYNVEEKTGPTMMKINLHSYHVVSRRFTTGCSGLNLLSSYLHA